MAAVLIAARKTPNAGPILVPAARPPLTPEQLALRRAKRRQAVADCHRRGGPVCRCGKQLLRTNVTGRCAACLRADRRPLPLPPCSGCGKRLTDRRNKTGWCQACRSELTVSARPKRPCAHCGRTRNIKAAGLCSACCLDPAVRPLYGRPVPRRHHNAPAADPPPEALEPTDAPPGSGCRAAVYAARAAAGLPLNHPGDRADWDGLGAQLWKPSDASRGRPRRRRA